MWNCCVSLCVNVRVCVCVCVGGWVSVCLPYVEPSAVCVCGGGEGVSVSSLTFHPEGWVGFFVYRHIIYNTHTHTHTHTHPFGLSFTFLATLTHSSLSCFDTQQSFSRSSEARFLVLLTLWERPTIERVCSYILWHGCVRTNLFSGRWWKLAIKNTRLRVHTHTHTHKYINSFTHLMIAAEKRPVQIPFVRLSKL